VGGAIPDAVTLFAAAAVRTKRVTFGTSIVPMYPRHPVALATQALVLADLAPGRFRLGVGPSHRPTIEGWFGIPFAKPHVYLREYVQVLRQLLWDGKVDYEGEVFKVHHMALPAGMAAPRVPILISALRANAFRLAGEITDGAISWMCPVPYLVQTALPALKAGADAAGRPVPPLIAHVPVALHTDREAVRAAARREIYSYGRLPFYARMFADAGFPVAADGTMPDALLDELVVSGDKEAVAARLAAIRARGMQEILVTHITVENQDSEELALIEAITNAAK
jgi:F420-dependent oxidoreductase-like protein